MQKLHSILRLSASDLAGRLNCHHLTSLDLAVANNELAKPKVWDAVLATLAERGAAHERSYIDHLRRAGHQIVELDPQTEHRTLAALTLQAMRERAEFIVQGAFADGAWLGRTDILKRVDKPSALGAWSYEVIDTKLARETKGATILQLCLYSDLLGKTQERTPDSMYVVAPWTGYALQEFRFSSYSAYYRKAKREFEASLEPASGNTTYPEPSTHCDVCRWRIHCDSQRRSDDHLCLVAGISKIQINELRSRDIRTVVALAEAALPLQWKPERGSAKSYTRVREQARVQVQSRVSNTLVHELLPLEPGLGLGALPAPSAGDIFLDLEGDPFAGEQGFEYLFGYAFMDRAGELAYCGDWALTREDEKRVFERFIDFALERWKQYPGLHIYHYAPYEPAALKRLMGRYATREDEVDRMLRGLLFVDLYQITRHAVRAGVESYSIKDLERLFGYARKIPLPDASRARAALETCLELADTSGITEEMKQAVAIYNQDDCVSAHALRGWLERLRDEQIAAGQSIERPVPSQDAPSEALAEWQARVQALVDRLTDGVPADPRERSEEQHARGLLANLLDWHRRESKAAHWEYFRLEALSAEDLRDDRAGLVGLEFQGAVGGTVKAPVHRYTFPLQDCELRGKESLYTCGGEKFGSIEAIAFDERYIDVKKRRDTAALHPAAIFGHDDPVRTTVLAESLMRIAECVADNGVTGANGGYPASRDLLLNRSPRVDGPIRRADESTLDAAIRVSLSLVKTGGVFAIQGPPGTGKTHTGAHMISALVKSGAKVGVTANSHKVIRKLLDDAMDAARKQGIDLRCVQKVSDEDETGWHGALLITDDNSEAFESVSKGVCQVAAGTAWFWAREEAHEAVDVLFVDEAAQMSLANVLAVSQAARTVILLGDPQQLDQPMQGSHPEGCDVSALDHILAGHKTIPPEKGLFLEQTWRLHPQICRFTSELFYEDRLQAIAGLELQQVKSTSAVRGSGLRYLSVPHEGNQSASREESDAIRELVTTFLDSGPAWIDRHGVEQRLTLEDILIIAPYNSQVAELQRALPGAHIGTVDKFQGQQAPVVIYSMTTSSHVDAPRGMSFLYSLNRLNVATSRARCLCILVCSPRIFEPECRTPDQIEMANAFCRYLELAEPIH